MNGQEPLTQSDLSSLLTETFLQGVSHFEETDSTNTQSLELIASATELATPHLVYAESQTAGRGRGSNGWWSQPGSLTFSIIVNSAQFGLSAEQHSLLSLLTGMALLRTGQSVLPSGDFAVKWPNDVYLNSRKLAGILTEVPPQSSKSSASELPRYAVIGVGLNVNNQFVNAPSELQATGISLSDLSGHAYDRIEILASYLGILKALIRSLGQGESVLDEWPAFCLLTGKRVAIEVGGNDVSGFCRGIDATGALLLDTVQGPRRFLGGVVKSWS